MSETDHESWPTSALIEAAYVEWRERDDDSPCPATVALCERGSREVLDAALTLCASLDPKCRIVGARILGQLGSPERTFPEECCDTLIALLRDPSEQVMTTAVYALGHLGNHRCDPELLALKDHPEPVVRKGVAFSLAGTNLPQAVPILLTLMDDDDVEARDWATTTVGQATGLDTPEIRAALLKRATEDDDEMTRGEALYGLAKRGDARAAPLIIAELVGADDPTDQFGEAAKACLGIDERQDVTIEQLLEELRAKRH